MGPRAARRGEEVESVSAYRDRNGGGTIVRARASADITYLHFKSFWTILFIIHLPNTLI